MFAITFLSGNTVEIILWVVILIVALLIEIFTAALTTIWFCAGSLVSLILSIFNVPIGYQILAFLAVSIILILLTRPLFKKFNSTAIVHTNADRIIDSLGVCTKTILVDDIGEVKVRQETWRAVTLDSSDIHEGDKIIVKSITGNKLLVSKISTENNSDEIIRL